MFLKIDDVNKETFTLPESIDNSNGFLQIAIHNISFWIGLYNIPERQRCLWARKQGGVVEQGTDFFIHPGFYNFKTITKDLKKEVNDLNIFINKTTGLVKLVIPDNMVLWLSEPIRHLFGIDHKSWLEGTYIGDRPAEFMPSGGINIYLNELATSNKLTTNNSETLTNSNLLGNIPMLSDIFAQHIVLRFVNPVFIKLRQGEINQLQFSLKLQWKNGKEQKLDNHLMPIGLELEIK